MTSHEAADFHRALAAVLETYAARVPSDEALRLWWAALERYPWAAVRAALAEHVARCKFAPRPADIRERIETRDGRPAPDEAWSLALGARDEARSLVWTAEIAAAWGVAQPILAAGDLIGARKAFLEAYQRRLEQARERLEPVCWQVSLGTDPAQRADALHAAAERGRLSRTQLERLLPSAQAPAPAALQAVAAMLAPGSAGAVAPGEGEGEGEGGGERGGEAEAGTERLLAAVRAGLAQGQAQREGIREQVQARRQREARVLEARRERQRQWLQDASACNR
jgi:hypothetical protein